MQKLYRIFEADREGTDFHLFLECDTAAEAMRWMSQLSVRGKRVRVRRTRHGTPWAGG